MHGMGRRTVITMVQRTYKAAYKKAFLSAHSLRSTPIIPQKALGFFSTAFGLKLAPGLVIPPDIPGDIKSFINGFYTAVDAGQGAQAVSYFSDDPKLVYNGKEIDGKANILAIFNQKTTDAIYEKTIDSIKLGSGTAAVVIQIHATFVETPKVGAQSTQSYSATLNFLDSSYVGKLSELDVTVG